MIDGYEAWLRVWALSRAFFGWLAGLHFAAGIRYFYGDEWIGSNKIRMV